MDPHIPPEMCSSEEPQINKPVAVGLTILGVFFGIFIIWSMLAPLDAAAIAEGKVTVESNRKTVQHLEGGIIKKILVRDGDKVKKGSPLLIIDDTRAKARFDLLNAQANELYALISRLEAERDEKDKITFSQALLDKKDDPEVRDLMKSQTNIFKSSVKAFNDRIKILHKRIEQSEKQITSYEAQRVSADKQLKLIKEEVKAVEYLEKRKLIEKPRLLALLREAAKLIGDRGEYEGQVLRAQQQIGESKAQIISLTEERRKEILKEMRDARAKLVDVLEQTKAAEDVYKRTVITSPQDGIVVGMKQHTIGGVIQAGNPILDIVPTEDKLIVEAEVSPLDIDVISKGMEARVLLTPYKQRHLSGLVGTVTHISADSYTDEKTGNTYYRVKVNINPGELKKLAGVKLYPGMPAQVMIITDKRTAFQYAVQPIRDSLRNAFRED